MCKLIIATTSHSFYQQGQFHRVVVPPHAGFTRGNGLAVRAVVPAAGAVMEGAGASLLDGSAVRSRQDAGAGKQGRGPQWGDLPMQTRVGGAY